MQLFEWGHYTTPNPNNRYIKKLHNNGMTKYEYYSFKSITLNELMKLVVRTRKGRLNWNDNSN